MPRKKSSISAGGGKKGKSRSLRRLFYWSAVAGIWVFMALFVTFLILAHDLPDIENLPLPGADERVEVRAADGSMLATYGAVYGEWLEYRQIPEMVKKAVIAIEDRRYMRHAGIDPRAILRAGWVNLWGGEVVEGGSTITQQLAKNIFLSSDRTFRRKAQEVLLALWLEARFTKEQILALYLNRVYFGSGAYGIDAAARTYFGHGGAEASLAEAAMLAGLLKAPSALAPNRHPDEAWARAKIVLGELNQQHSISDEARAHASASMPRIRPLGGGDDVRYFTDYVIEAARGLLSDDSRALVVTTTLNQNLQAAAERALQQGLAGEGKRVNASQGALVALSPDGGVLAMAGGRSYSESQFNRATSAFRQPGSAFKPFVYLAGFEAGLDPDEILNDAPITVDRWSPKNYSGSFAGPTPLKSAFAHSINSVAVRVSERAGREHVAEVARRFGLAVDEPVHPSVALGAYETSLLNLAGAYAGIAGGGSHVDPFAILEIRSADGQLLYRHTPDVARAVMDEKYVAELTDFMVETIQHGTGFAARIDRPAAGKTGTSQDFRDAWFLGFTSDMTAGVWVGNDDGAPMKSVTGGGLPARVWRDFMIEAHAGREARPLALAPGDAGRDEAAANPSNLIERIFGRAD